MLPRWLARRSNTINRRIWPATASRGRWQLREEQSTIDRGNRFRGSYDAVHRDLQLTGSLKGTTFSGVAFAFATNTEAKEDIITEWPGAGTQSKQKVGDPRFKALRCC